MKLSPQQRYIYELYLTDPPTRRSGTGLLAGYWRGLNGNLLDGRIPYLPQSLAYAAYLAGRKHRAMREAVQASTMIAAMKKRTP